MFTTDIARILFDLYQYSTVSSTKSDNEVKVYSYGSIQNSPPFHLLVVTSYHFISIYMIGHISLYQPLNLETYKMEMTAKKQQLPTIIGIKIWRKMGFPPWYSRQYKTACNGSPNAIASQ